MKIMKKILLSIMIAAAMLLPVSVRSQVQLPIHQDFEQENCMQQWSQMNVVGGSGRDPNEERSGEYSYCFHHTNHPSQFLISPQFMPTQGTEVLTLWYRIPSYSHWTEMFSVGFSLTTSDTTAFTWGDTITVNETLGEGWHEYTVAVPEGARYAAIRSMAYDAYELYIDDIYIGDTTCYGVFNAGISASMGNDLTISWVDTMNDDATYSIFIVTDHYTTLLESGVTGNSYTIHNLAPNTEYSFGIRADCSSESTGMTLVSARTSCAAAELPFIERFNSELGAGSCWAGYSGVSAAEVFAGATLRLWEPSVMWGTRWEYYSNRYRANVTMQHYKWLFSPLIDLSYADTTVQLSFDLSLTSSIGHAVYDNEDNELAFMVLISLDGGRTWADSNTVSWRNRGGDHPISDIVSTSLIGQAINLARYAGDTIRIAFYAQSSSYGTFHLDNVRVGEGPECPRVTGLTVSNIGDHGATLNWNRCQMPEGSDQWSIDSYDIINMADSSLVANVSDTFAVITGLRPMTNHTLGVQTQCNHEAAIISTISFTTDCAPMPLPFEEEFNTDDFFTNPCWGRNYTTSVDAVLAGTPLVLEHNAYHIGWSWIGLYDDLFCYASLGGNTKQWMVMPEIDLGQAQSAQLSFNIRLSDRVHEPNLPNDIYRGDPSVAFIVLVSLDGGQTWVDSNTVRWQNFGGQHTLAEIEGTEYFNQIVDLNRYLGDTIRIAFYAQGLTTVSTLLELCIDNIAVTTVPRCLPVNSLTVDSIVADSVWLHWTSAAGLFDISLMQDNVEITTAQVIVNGTSALIYGLDLNEDYQIMVRSDCGNDDYGEWSEIVGVHTGYCLPNFGTLNGDGINYVSFGGMTNTEGHPFTRPTFAVFTDMVGTVAADSMAEVCISYTRSGIATSIWVDWNDNAHFESDELVYTGYSPQVMPSLLTASFYVHPSYALGEYRIRIIGSYNGMYADPNRTNPCGVVPSGYATFGEDYTLAVGPAPSCWRVFDLQADSATGTSVFLSWSDTHNVGATYSIYNMADTSLIAFGIGDTSFEVTGLDPLTYYTFGVATNCSASDASQITTITTKTDCPDGSCYITIDGQDMFGDGWDNNAIRITQDGEVIGSFTVNNNIQATQSYKVCSGSPVVFEWVSANNYYLNEISFQIKNSSGEAVYTVSNGSLLTAGTIFTLDSACVQYIFTPDSVLVNVTVDNPQQGSVGSNVGYSTYVIEGETVVATAHPAERYMFDHWTVEYSNQTNPVTNTVTTNPLQLHIDANMVHYDCINITAYFRVRPIDSLTVIVAATGGGHTTPGPGTYNLAEGSSMTLTAVAAEGYHFLYWLRDYENIMDETIIDSVVVVVAEQALVGHSVSYTAYFAENNAIDNAEGTDVIVYSLGDKVVVVGAEGETVAVYDVVGRRVAFRQNVANNVVIPVPCTGVYVVRFGNGSVHRVVVLK